jgi:Family of unknown function (DUF5304)
VSQDSGDVPFQDQPIRRDPVAGPDGAGDRERDTAEEPRATEERTAPHSGSTRPTTMREDFGTLADEGRKLWEAVETRIVAPAIRSYPEMAEHLGAAGRELMAAYRAVVRGQERVWREQDPDSRREKITVERVDRSGTAAAEPGRDEDRH